MKKCLSILLCVGLMIIAVFSFTGCSRIIETKTYNRNDVNSLYDKINSQAQYNISYDLRKSQILYNNINGIENEVYRYTYEITNTSLKRTGTERDNYKYDFRGTYYEQKSIDAKKGKYNFRKYNDDKYMYSIVNNEEKLKQEMSSVSYALSTVNMAASAYSDKRALKRITQYLYSDGSYQYVLEYLHTSEDEQADMLSLLYGSPGASLRKDSDTVFEPAKDRDGADIMRMFMFVDREGRVTKQIIEVKVNIRNVDVNTVVNAYGYIEYYATINYRW